MAVVMQGVVEGPASCKRKNVPGEHYGLDTRRDDMKARFFRHLPVQRPESHAHVLDRPGEYSQKVVRGNLLSIEEYLGFKTFIQRGAVGSYDPVAERLYHYAHHLRDVLPVAFVYRVQDIRGKSGSEKKTVSVSDSHRIPCYRVDRSLPFHGAKQTPEDGITVTLEFYGSGDVVHGAVFKYDDGRDRGGIVNIDESGNHLVQGAVAAGYGEKRYYPFFTVPRYGVELFYGSGREHLDTAAADFFENLD